MNNNFEVNTRLDASKAIESIFLIENENGVGVLKDVQNLNSSEKEWSITNITSLPIEVILTIFKMSGGTQAFGKMMQISQYFFYHVNDPNLWKAASLKEIPNLLEYYPSLQLDDTEIVWKKVYADEVPHIVNLKQWEGPHTLPISFLYRSNKGFNIVTKKINVNLDSDKLSLKIMKKIIKKEFELSYNLSQITLSISGKDIMDKESTILKEINLNDSSRIAPTFMKLLEAKLPLCFSIKKSEPVIPENDLPNGWNIHDKEDSLAVNKSNESEAIKTGKKKKKFENCIMM